MMDTKILASPNIAADDIEPCRVMFDDGGEVNTVTSATQAAAAAVKPLGISRIAAAAGQDTTTCYSGSTMAEAGAAVAAGDELVAQAETGKLIPFVASDYTAAGSVWITARALEAAAGDGAVFRVDVGVRSKTIDTDTQPSG